MTTHVTDEDKELIAQLKSAFKTMIKNEVSLQSEAAYSEEFWIQRRLRKLQCFAQSILGFMNLKSDDQTTHLGKSVIDVFALQWSRNYMQLTEQLGQDGDLLTLRDMQEMQATSTAMTQVENVFQGLSSLRLDDTELALMSALSMREDKTRPEEDITQVGNFSTALSRYMTEKYPDCVNRYDISLKLLEDMHGLHFENEEQVRIALKQIFKQLDDESRC